LTYISLLVIISNTKEVADLKIVFGFLYYVVFCSCKIFFFLQRR